MMFDATQRKGLMGRMVKNLGLGSNPMAGALVYPIASACYPKAIKKNEDGILEPIISRDLICKLTEQTVDYGLGSIDDLYAKIWGVDGFSGYLEKFMEQLDS